SGRLETTSDSVAYVGHADGLKSTLTVSENLAFWASIFGQTGIQAALERFNLTSLQNRPAGMLSAGQKRRLGLARLMVTGRKVWLLDEPTVSLDATNVVLFTDVLRDHLDAGGSAIIASHLDIAIDGIEKLDLTTLRVDLETVDFLGEALL
ncbi:MAG: heme ABC exporter ATP-binding protein CcmA, partial [Pseudomonadota bacterium]